VAHKSDMEFRDIIQSVTMKYG